jgi:hypothetical protein
MENHEFGEEILTLPMRKSTSMTQLGMWKTLGLRMKKERVLQRFWKRGIEVGMKEIWMG